MSKRRAAPASSGVTDSDRIAGRGREIILGGRLHRVRFGLSALKYLEDKYNGMDRFVARLSQRGWGVGKVRAIVDGMVAGTLHEKPAELSEAEWHEGIEGALDENVDGLIGWINTLAMAITEGWPEVVQASPGPKDEGSRRRSRGRTSTTSPRSRSGAATRRSGA